MCGGEWCGNVGEVAVCHLWRLCAASECGCSRHGTRVCVFGSPALLFSADECVMAAAGLASCRRQEGPTPHRVS